MACGVYDGLPALYSNVYVHVHVDGSTVLMAESRLGEFAAPGRQKADEKKPLVCGERLLMRCR
jgi:hypothetical protein